MHWSTKITNIRFDITQFMVRMMTPFSHLFPSRCVIVREHLYRCQYQLDDDDKMTRTDSHSNVDANKVEGKRSLAV